MLVSNSSSSSVSTNKNLNKNRTTIYKHKAQFFKNPNLQQVELELVSKEVQAELNEEMKKENRVRRIADVITVALIIMALSGILIWLF